MLLYILYFHFKKTWLILLCTLALGSKPKENTLETKSILFRNAESIPNIHVKIVCTSIYQVFHIWRAVIKFIKLRWELQAFFPNNSFQADALLQETCGSSSFAPF